MPCYHPIKAYKKPDGGISFSSKGAYSDHEIQIPCRGCIGCRLDRQSDWKTRLVHESKKYKQSMFLTATYDEEHVPKNGSLDRKAMPALIKRIRAYNQRHPENGIGRISFFQAGEYGGKFNRPHYHALLFGQWFPDARPIKRSDKEQSWRSEILEGLWGKGRIEYGSVTPQSCAYVAGYVMKKINGQMAETHYQRIDPETGELYLLVPEHATMSLRPAIGREYVEKYHDEIYRSDSVILKGKEVPPPEYYDRFLEKTDPELHRRIKLARIFRAAKPENLRNNTPERLAVREECKKSKINLYKSQF